MTKLQKEVLEELRDASKSKPDWVVGDHFKTAMNMVKSGVLNAAEDDQGNVGYWIRKPNEPVVPFDFSHTFMVFGEFSLANNENFFYLRVPEGVAWKLVFAAIKRVMKRMKLAGYWNVDGVTKKMWNHRGDKHVRLEFIRGEFRHNLERPL